MSQTFRIHLPPEEFDLQRCVNSGQVFRWNRDGDIWHGIDADIWYQATPTPDGALQVLSNGTEQDFRHLFNLNVNARQVEAEILTSAPELEPYMNPSRGLRLMQCRSAEETFFTFLCTPNNHLPRITGMVKHLATYGDPVPAPNNQSVHHFPPAGRLAQIPEDELRAHRFGYRAATITQSARALANKSPGWLESLKSIPYPEAFAELIQMPGVGPKLADCIALFGLQHTEAVPIDTHIWQQLVRIYRPDWAGRSLTPALYREAGDLLRIRVGKLAGWAQQYLFYDNLLRGRERKGNK